MRVVRVSFAVAAIAFFAAPIAARVAGVTAERFENRRLASTPRLAQGWDAFQQTSRYLTDHMPLRAQAVRANTRIWTDLLGTDPRYGAPPRNPAATPASPATPATPANAEMLAAAAAAVVTGRDGWLYLRDDLRAACTRAISDRDALRRWGALVHALRAEGHAAVALVAPDKSSVYPEHLPVAYPGDGCAPAAKDRFWNLLSRHGPAAGVLELRSELVRRKRLEADDLYQRKDSHWSTPGALVLVERLLDAVGGGVRMRPDEVVDRGEVEYTGDLTLVAGASETDTRPERTIARAPGAPLVPGRTLLVGDSFTERWMPHLRPYFESLRRVSWDGTDRRAVAAAIRKSDTVVLETVERAMNIRASDGRVVFLTRSLR